MAGCITSRASLESPAQPLWELNFAQSVAVYDYRSNIRKEIYLEGPWVEFSWIFWGFCFWFVCCVSGAGGSSPQVPYVLDQCPTSEPQPQLLVQHLKIVNINSCFTYSNFIRLNIVCRLTLNKYLAPMLKISRFSFWAPINMTWKRNYRNSATLLWAIPPSFLCWHLRVSKQIPGFIVEYLTILNTSIFITAIKKYRKYFVHSYIITKPLCMIGFKEAVPKSGLLCLSVTSLKCLW